MPHDVLIVEDDEGHRELLQRRMERAEITVLTAASAPEALRMVAEHRPRVVVLDLTLGSDTGESVIAKIKQDPDMWTTPIIVLSGHHNTRREAAWEAGCDDYVTKPVDFAELLGKVRSLLP